MARILLVDDSSFQRKSVCRLLSDLGHEVAEAENGEVGLHLAESKKPDLIITDLLMPVMDGLSLLRGLKRRGLATPAIVASADIQQATREECLHLGARAFLTKPITTADLETAIGQALDPRVGEKSGC